MAKSVMTLGNNDDLKLKVEQLIDEAYIRGHEDGKKIHEKVRNDDMGYGYQRGLEDAWEWARKIMIYEYPNGISDEQFHKIFDTVNKAYVLKHLTAQEAMQKIKDYERRQKWAEQAKRGKEHRDEIEKMLEGKKTEPKYENCKKCRRLIELNDCHMEGCCGWYYYEPMNTKDNYVDAIIKVKVPKWQIGEKVNLYFKDTMSIDGICEADKK